MRGFLFSAAASAALVVIVAISGGMVMFKMLEAHPVFFPRVDIGPELRAFFTFIILGSMVAGALGWLLVLLARRDGTHRLAAVETIVRSKV